jgi:acyl carrier protein
MFTLDEARGLIEAVVGRRALDCKFELDTRFEDVGFTSLDIAEMLFAIEDHLQMEIELIGDSRPETLGELIDLVNRMALPSMGSAK